MATTPTQKRPDTEASTTLPTQVEDDPALLECMLADQQASSELYRPTNYWAHYMDATVEYLRSKGLADFRRSEEGYLPSFGATDLPVTHPALSNIINSGVSVDAQERLAYLLQICESNPAAGLLPHGLSIDDLDLAAWRLTELQGRAWGARPLGAAGVSTVASPAHAFEVDGKPYTHSYLYYYLRYAYCSQFVDFDELENVVEVGSGAGRQAEVLKKYHPHLNIYQIDLAPQLYVAGQYLKSVFPDAVRDYRETREIEHPTAQDGEVLLLANRRIEDIRPSGRTLFWNAASFGEMEPAVVENYLTHARAFADAVYLYQCMAGKEVGEAGQGGVLEQTRFEDYTSYLGDAYELQDISIALAPLKAVTQSGGYGDALWRRAG